MSKLDLRYQNGNTFNTFFFCILLLSFVLSHMKLKNHRILELKKTLTLLSQSCCVMFNISSAGETTVV